MRILSSVRCLNLKYLPRVFRIDRKDDFIILFQTTCVTCVAHSSLGQLRRSQHEPKQQPNKPRPSYRYMYFGWDWEAGQELEEYYFIDLPTIGYLRNILKRNLKIAHNQKKKVKLRVIKLEYLDDYTPW